MLNQKVTMVTTACMEVIHINITLINTLKKLMITKDE